MPDPVRDLVRLVRQRLADEADPARAEVYAAHPLPDREVTPVIRAWAVDDDLWLRRTHASTPAGCGRSSPSTSRGSPACRGGRRSSTCEVPWGTVG